MVGGGTQASHQNYFDRLQQISSRPMTARNTPGKKFKQKMP
jgi:hypothetical protein